MPFIQARYMTLFGGISLKDIHAKLCAPIKIDKMRKRKIELRLSFNWNVL